MQIITQNVVTMSSREIAELTGKEHKNVMADIRKMLEELGMQPAEFSAGYMDAKGEVRACFSLFRREVEILLTGYSIQLRAKCLDRLRELEANQQPVALPSYVETLRLYADQLEATQRVTVERDQAIATKALIGSKREATAMAKASTAVREVNRLKAELGRNQKHATIIAVERATGERMAKNAYVELRRWCRNNGAVAVDVVDARYGTVKAWPADAWINAYGIDLCALFQSCEVAQ